MTTRPGNLMVFADSVGKARLLAVNGVLDGSTYLRLRDSVIKAALDQPSAVLIDVADLYVPAPSAWSAFTSARWHVSAWPAIPIMLICPRPQTAAIIARHGVTRYVPVYPNVAAALRSIAHGGPPRERMSAELPRSPESLRSSRELVAQWFTRWSQRGLIPVAKVVVDVLVENVLRHTTSAPVVLAENVGDTVTIAVQDTSPRPAMRREEGTGGTSRVAGLAVVAALCRHWGSIPTPTGKTVWAVIGPENRL